MLVVPMQAENLLDNPIGLVISLVVFALIPFLILSFTSFVKLHVVFAVLKNAIGGGQIPSAALVTLLSLVLTAQIMAPVVLSVYAEGSNRLAPILKNLNDTGAGDKTQINLAKVASELGAVAEPAKQFLRKHSASRERKFFADLAMKQGIQWGGHSETNATCGEENQLDLRTCEFKGETLFSLTTAFVISELKEAFAIGFSIFLPFLVVDMVVAHLLVGLGMMMVSPVSISLPFKLLLFVMCDGWYLLCKGLVLGYL